ncbi:hypothetical protein AHAS_Ahas04G0145300 [Arachis hypogaea]
MCSANDVKFEKVIVEGSRTTFYYIASRKLEECINRCQTRHANSPEMKKICMVRCIIFVCLIHYPKDIKKTDECINKMFAWYMK